MKSYAFAAGLLCSGWMVFAAGCSRSGSTAAVEKPANERYALTGEVISVDAAHHTIRVRHDEVKNYMPAMTMDFAVAAGDLVVVKPGERIRAELVPSKDAEPRLEKIWPDDKPTADAVAAGARQLHEDTHNRGKNVYREIGETLPDFALYDQDGRVVQSARFRGKQIMLNFIYTRCPIATMCPASTAKMMMTQKLAREAGVKNLELVSISFEPEYDTPGVLKEYATARGIDTTNFSFLTGPESAIRDLLAQFGVIAEFKDGVAQHTLATLLIDENGRIVHRADGSQWEPQEFVAKMHRT
ncbi:MAG TPA: SCO family protein [Opitutaceae bacterium]|nr:SCO family protein [Opitutaceae bacterium]